MLHELLLRHHQPLLQNMRRQRLNNSRRILKRRRYLLQRAPQRPGVDLAPEFNGSVRRKEALRRTPLGDALAEDGGVGPEAFEFGGFHDGETAFVHRI